MKKLFLTLVGIISFQWMGAVSVSTTTDVVVSDEMLAGGATYVDGTLTIPAGGSLTLSAATGYDILQYTSFAYSYSDYTDESGTLKSRPFIASVYDASGQQIVALYSSVANTFTAPAAKIVFTAQSTSPVVADFKVTLSASSALLSGTPLSALTVVPNDYTVANNVTDATWKEKVLPLPVATAGSTTFCGDGNGDLEHYYTDITAFQTLSFVVSEVTTPGTTLRAFIWNAETQTVETLYANLEGSTTNTVSTPGVYTINVADKSYLKGLKTAWGDGAYSCVVSDIYLTQKTAESAFEDLRVNNASAASWQQSQWVGSAPTFPFAMATSTLLVGDGNGSTEGIHVGVSDFTQIRFEVGEVSQSGAELRVWLWDADAGKVVTLYPRLASEAAGITDPAVWATSAAVTVPGLYVLDLCGYTDLKGIKTSWAGGSFTLTDAYLYRSDDYVSKKDLCDYTVTGGYVPELISAVADVVNADVTRSWAFDLTGMNTPSVFDPYALQSTPGNALYYCTLGTGQTNTNTNVVSAGQCAKLLLTDGGGDFAVTHDFTAGEASYSRTFAGFGTMVLPFAAVIPAGATVSTLTASTTEVVATEITESVIPANTPVLVQAEGEVTFVAASVPVSTPAELTVADMTGVYASVQAEAGSYVLQNKDGELAFYLVAEGQEPTITPFRAYLTPSASASSAPALRIRFITKSETSIKRVESSAASHDAAIYDLLGRRVVRPESGRIYISAGKRFICQ